MDRWRRELVEIKNRIDECRKIDKFLDGHIDGTYTINQDLTVDVEGSCLLYKMNMSKLPEYLKFGKVTDDFGVHFNQLETLKGCPYYVGNRFSCRSNKLKTLKYIPKKVMGKIICDDNMLTTLEGVEIHLPSYGISFDGNPCSEIYAELGFTAEAHHYCRGKFGQ